MLTFDEALDLQIARELPAGSKPAARKRQKEAILRDRQEQVWREVRRGFAVALAEVKLESDGATPTKASRGATLP